MASIKEITTAIATAMYDDMADSDAVGNLDEAAAVEIGEEAVYDISEAVFTRLVAEFEKESAEYYARLDLMVEELCEKNKPAIDAAIAGGITSNRFGSYAEFVEDMKETYPDYGSFFNNTTMEEWKEGVIRAVESELLVRTTPVADISIVVHDNKLIYPVYREYRKLGYTTSDARTKAYIELSQIQSDIESGWYFDNQPSPYWCTAKDNALWVGACDYTSLSAARDAVAETLIAKERSRACK